MSTAITQAKLTTTFKTRAMLDALAAVSGAVKPNSPKVILQSVLLDCNQGGSTLAATDLENWIRAEVAGMSVEIGDVGFAIVLPPGRLREILASVPDEELTIFVAGDWKAAEIRGAKCRFSMTLQNPDEFPSVESLGLTDYHEVAAEDIKKLIRRAGLAVDPNNTQYTMGGVAWEFGPTSITCAGTDGKRMGMQTVPAAVVGEGSPGSDKDLPIVPVKSLRVLDRILDSEGTVRVCVALDDNRIPKSIMFESQGVELTSRLIAGRFPPFRMMLDFRRDAAYQIKADAGVLHKAAAQAAIMISEESRTVHVTFSSADKTVAFRAEASEAGGSEAEAPIDSIRGGDVTAMFDGRYLRDGLESMGKLPITIDLIDANQTMFLTSEDGQVHAIQPLTREEQK